jgi:RNA polymerase sigma-70 factor (ECF subfamily)
MDEHKRDEGLMAEVARGSREALTLLVRRFATPLLTFLERMVRDRHRSEELFQEVWVAVWSKRHSYTHPRPFKNWLYAIALNQCRAAFRRASLPTTPFEETLAPAPESSPADAAIATETAALVSAAVSLLPPQQRTVVVLRIWQELSYEEIADVLEVAEGTVRAHMHHGLRALRKYLEPRLT